MASFPRPGVVTAPRKNWWLIAAAVAWSLALSVLLIRAGLHPARPTSLTTYFVGGMAWAHQQPLYLNWRGFVYSPPVAWFFSILARLPLAMSAVLWRFLTAGFFLFGLGRLMRRGPFERLPQAAQGFVFLGVLPLSLGNIDNAQANPLVAGLMMLSLSAAYTGGWTLCAIAIGVAAFVKIYPLALGLLLCLIAPRQLIWRLGVVLIVVGLLPFALQSPAYVSGQYGAWWQSRLQDDRFHYPLHDAPLDLWYLLVRWGGLPLNEHLYTAFQALSGVAIAGWVWLQQRRQAPTREILAGLFFFVSVWMLLLGPATENQTYVILAPAACLLCALPGGMRGRVLSAAGCMLLLAGTARNSLAPHLKSAGWMTLQPIAALFLLAALIFRTSTAPGSRRAP